MAATFCFGQHIRCLHFLFAEMLADNNARRTEEDGHGENNMENFCGHCFENAKIGDLFEGSLKSSSEYFNHLLHCPLHRSIPINFYNLFAPGFS